MCTCVYAQYNDPQSSVGCGIKVAFLLLERKAHLEFAITGKDFTRRNMSIYSNHLPVLLESCSVRCIQLVSVMDRTIEKSEGAQVILVQIHLEHRNYLRDAINQRNVTEHRLPNNFSRIKLFCSNGQFFHDFYADAKVNRRPGLRPMPQAEFFRFF